MPESATEAIELMPLLGLAAVFAADVAAGPHLFDAGELAAAAWELGGSHPPGQPLHALLAHALARVLPVGPLAARMALLSALCALVAARAGGRAASLLTTRAGAKQAAPIASACASLAIGLCPLVLRQALRIEVYTLALALTSVATLALLRWALASPGEAAFAHARRHLWTACVAAGLAASVHPPHAAACVALGLSLALLRRPDVLRSPATLFVGGSLSLGTALAVYAYLPLRAGAGAFMWGEPGQLAGFWEYISGAIYAHNRLPAQAHSQLAAISDYLLYVSEVTGVVPWLGIPLLMRSGLPGAPRLAAALLLGVVAMCAGIAIQPLERINPDNVAYAGPAAVLLIIAGVGGTCAAWNRGRRGWVIAGLILIALNPFHAADLPARLSSDLPALETLTGSLTETPAPRALVVITQDASAGNWMLAQRLDGARPDAALFIAGLSASRFQWRALAGHPAFDGRPHFGPGADRHEQLLQGLLARARTRVGMYLEREASGYEHSPVAGAYLVADPSLQASAKLVSNPTAPRPAVDRSSIGERLAGALGADRRVTPAGDHGLAAAILRGYELTRARRLVPRGATAAAMVALRNALPELTRAQAEAFAALSGPPKRPFPGVIDDPDGTFTTRAEAERTAAAHAFALGADALARDLLRGQVERGEVRGLLQQALLAQAGGDPAGARAAITAFVAAAPDLAHEADGLFGP